MIDEIFLQNAIRIRRTYLKLSNNMDLYQKKAKEVAERLENTLNKVDDISKKAQEKKMNNDSDTIAILNEVMSILKSVEDEGISLEKLVDPLNKDIEKLALEEQELYRKIKEKHFTMTDDEIVNEVKQRLINENLV